MQSLPFSPLFSSPHLQTVLPLYLPQGKAPPSIEERIPLGDHDFLSVQTSTPPHWSPFGQIAFFIHGMSGSHDSSYMVRMSRKAYEKGVQTVRVNLRNCGSGKGLSKLPYHGGTSQDIKKVLLHFKDRFPEAKNLVFGFSLGGNIVLKLAGELGETAPSWAQAFFAICPPLDLGKTVSLLEEKKNRLYHAYYVKHSLKGLTLPQKTDSLRKLDEIFTAPLWGYQSAEDYYSKCSSLPFLSHIRQKTFLLFAQDDPFISLEPLQGLSLPPCISTYATRHGGHMGFLSSSFKDLHWMDQTLLSWISSFAIRG